MEKIQQRLQRRLKIITLTHDQIERLPDDRDKVKPGRVGDTTCGNAGIGAAGTNGLRNVRTGRTNRAWGGKLIKRNTGSMQKREQQQLRAGAVRPHGKTGALLADILD